jgi:hypothetical protein
MKIILIALIAFSQLLSTSLIAKEVPTKKPNDIEVTVTIGGKIGVESKGCRGLGISCLRLDVDVVTTRFGKAPEGSTIIQFEVLSNKQLRMTFFSENSGDMEIESNLSLGEKLSKALGFKDIVVQKGNYRTQKRSDGAYVVTTSAVFIK